MKTIKMKQIVIPILLVFMCLTLTGCFESQLAKFNNSSTEKMLFKAKDMEAPKYAAQAYTTASTELELSKKSLSQGDNKGAYEHAKAAKAQAKQAFEVARAGKAEADFLMADKKFRVATENEAKRTSPAKYQKLQENLEQARKYQARTKKNYEQIIKYSNLVIDDVKSILAEVMKLADKEVGEAQNILDDAKRNEAETRVPDAWAKARSDVDDAQKLKGLEQYYKAIEKAKEAQTQANIANNLAMESKAREEMASAEKLMGALKDVDAQKYTRAKYNMIEQNYISAQQAFQDKDYRIAIDVARMVQARAPEVLEEAGSLKLQDQIRIAQQDIDTLKVNDAEKYAPGFLSEAEALLEEARKAFKNQEYEQVKSIHKDIREKIELANERLKVRAEDFIRDAEVAIKDAEDSGSSKYSIELLNSAQEMRDNSLKLLNNKEFRKSILTAQSTITKAQEAKTAALKKMAELSLDNVEKLISASIGEGAQLYANEDIQEAKDILKQGREALLGGQYTKAQDLSIQVKNKVDDAYTTMRKKAVAQIDEARKAIANAEDKRYMVDHYESAVATIKKAQDILQSAEGNLNSLKYTSAIEKAVESRATAIDAKNLAIRLQINDRAPVVKRQIEEARLARAFTYSIEDYDKALTNIKNCFDNLGVGRYDIALDNIDAAEKNAETALKGQVIRARNNIESAKSIGAWKHDNAQLQMAVIQLDNAEKLMKSKNYAESLVAANASLAASSLAQQNSRDKIFFAEISQINMLIANARMAGAMIPEKVNELRIKTDQTDKKYRASKDMIERFTSGMDMLSKLKTEAANLDSEAKVRREEINKQIETGFDSAKAIKASEFADKEFSKAQESWRNAEAAYQRQDYPAAKASYDSALALLKQINILRQEKDYKTALSVQMTHLNKAMADFSEIIAFNPVYLKSIKDGKVADTYMSIDQNFHNVVSLSPEFLQGAKGDTKEDTYRGLQGKMNAAKFRQILTETYVRAKAITPPPTMSGLHAKALKMFEEAKLAADFFDKFGYTKNYTGETRDKFIDDAFIHLKASWQLKHEVDSYVNGVPAVGLSKYSFVDWIQKNDSKKTPPGESFLEWLKRI